MSLKTLKVATVIELEMRRTEAASRSPQIAFLGIFSEMESEKESLTFLKIEKPKLKYTQLVLVLGKNPKIPKINFQN